MRIGYFLASEEYDPRELVEQAKKAEQAGFHALWISDHYHPWNDEQGHIALRVVRDRRAQRGHEPARHHRRHLPDGAHPSGGHRPGRGHQRRHARRALHARRRQRRGAQRAHPRRPLARGRRAAGDARGGRRGHPHAVAGRAAEPPRQALHGRERARLRPARDAAADPRLRLRAEGDRARRPHRRRLRDHVPGQGRDRPLPRAGRDGPVHAGTKVCYGKDEDEGARDRPPAVAQRGAAGRARPGPPHAEPLRAGVRARDPRPAQRARSAPTSTSTSSRSRPTRRPAWTSSSSSRSARSRTCSSTSGPRRSWHEGTDLSRQARRPGRQRPRPDDRAADGRDHPRHLDRPVRLGPAPLRGARPVHRRGRRARPRADGRRRGGRAGGGQPRRRRPRRGPVQHLLRPLLDVRPRAADPVRDHPGARPGHGRRAVRLHEALRPGRRRAGRVPARAAGPVRADQGARRPARRPLPVPLGRAADRLAGRRVRADPRGRQPRRDRPRPDRRDGDAGSPSTTASRP